MFDCLYVNGDSWVYGSELIDPTRPDIENHFDSVHERYRLANCWPQLLANQLNLELVNGSFPGAGNDRILRTSMFDLADLIAKGRRPLAVISWSQLQRFELSNRGKDLFRSFVGPGDGDLPGCVKQIWAEWSSDHCDVVKWVVQLISLHSFCRVNSIPVLGQTIFSTPYFLLEQRIHTREFAPYLSQLYSVCELPQQQYQFSLESMLKQHPDVKYGPGGHPLADGQKILAKHIETNLRQRFKFN